jgi:hypothetical protein
MHMPPIQTVGSIKQAIADLYGKALRYEEKVDQYARQAAVYDEVSERNRRQAGGNGTVGRFIEDIERSAQLCRELVGEYRQKADKCESEARKLEAELEAYEARTRGKARSIARSYTEHLPGEIKE